MSDVDVWLQSQQGLSSSFDSNQLVTDLYLCCVELFRTSLANRTDGDSRSFRKNLRAEGQRLILWGKDFEATTGGLEEILTNTPRLRSTVVGVFVDLGQSLCECGDEASDENFLKASSRFTLLTERASNLVPEKSNLREENQVTPISGNVSPESDISIGRFSPDQEEILEDVKSYIACLYGLSPVLQNPAERLSPTGDSPHDQGNTFQNINVNSVTPFVNENVNQSPMINLDLAQGLGEVILKSENEEVDERLPEKGKSPNIAGDIPPGKTLGSWERVACFQPRKDSVQISFIARVEKLTPLFGNRGPRYNEKDLWSPPTACDELTASSPRFFRWRDGKMDRISIPKFSSPEKKLLSHDVASVFTQTESGHFLVADVNATAVDANGYSMSSWSQLSFNHARLKEKSNKYYTRLEFWGNKSFTASPMPTHISPQLVPRAYDRDEASAKEDAGLIGSLSLLIALAAFSAPEEKMEAVMTESVKSPKWRPHYYSSGRTKHRGVIVTIAYDPDNPKGSTKESLTALEKGELGPFYS